MAQSTGMAATFVAATGSGRPRANAVRHTALALLAMLALSALVPLAAHASGKDGATGPTSDAEVGQAMKDATERARQAAKRLRAERRLRGEDDGYDAYGAEEAQAAPAPGLGSLLSGRSGLMGTALLAAAYYFLFMRGRGGSGGSSGWGSYYLFWIAAPALLAAVSSHPAFLILIVVGVIARRWLPDPILILKHRSRVRSLQGDIDANASNATARRDLAKIWLEKHRPLRALPLLEQAIARDPSSVELLYLSGLSHLLAGHHERAVEALVAVAHREPNFQYGEAYLRAADALIALGRWDDADDALERYAKINSSNIEARCKRVRVCKARNDSEGAQKAQADLRDAWRSLPGYQRRKQLGWYLRSLV
jgi:tetratricopeptide (TPR) repeat protein